MHTWAHHVTSCEHLSLFHGHLGCQDHQPASTHTLAPMPSCFQLFFTNTSWQQHASAHTAPTWNTCSHPPSRIIVQMGHSFFSPCCSSDVLACWACCAGSSLLCSLGLGLPAWHERGQKGCMLAVGHGCIARGQYGVRPALREVAHARTRTASNMLMLRNVKRGSCEAAASRRLGPPLTWGCHRCCLAFALVACDADC